MRAAGGLLVAGMLAASVVTQAAPIQAVAYEQLVGAQLVTFDDLPAVGAPGTNYDAIFASGGAAFGERFSGQTLGASGNFDVLGGTPLNPLTLMTGAAGRNLGVYLRETAYDDETGTSATTNVLTGLGHLGFPHFDAIGEGAFAVLFGADQSEFGFQLVGGGGGSATVDFFRRDGSLIAQILLQGLADASYGFRRDGGIRDIAGISIFNDDPHGVGFDNLRYDVPGRSGEPGNGGTSGGDGAPGSGVAIAEPGSMVLLGIGIFGLAVLRPRRS